MAWAPDRGISRIPPRIRDKVDTSIVTTVSAQMRYMCMDVTMEMIKNLEQFESGDKFYCTVRGLMMIAYGVPIKIMNVGLYPYEQNILPAIASALSYSPMTCVGSTPSVQILSQAMAAVGIFIKERIKRGKKDQDGFGDVTEYMLMSKFAMLLRCSYVCSSVGVAFTNCVPVPVDSMAKRIMCASFFSEWLGEMIKIHNSFGFKMTIMAMGAFSADTVRRTFSSYRGTAEMVNYIGVTNPAAISYMNVEKHTITSPIPNSVTSMELEAASIVGWQPTLDNVSSYEWKMYPKSVLFDFMKEKQIGGVTRALIDHTAEELFDYFSTMARNLFNNANMGGNPGMNATSIPPGAMTSNIPQDVPNASPLGSTVGRPQNNTQNNTLTGGIFGKGEESVVQAGQKMQPQEGTQIYAGRNSMLMQLSEPKGGNKSQQTIVVENMIGKLSEILEAYRSREKRVERLNEKVETLVDRTSWEDEEVMEVMEVYKTSVMDMMKEMEQAVSVAAALPTIFEGVVGAIENEIQPSAPLMRRYDGTTMRDTIYAQMTADRESGVAQSRNPPAGNSVFSNSNTMQNQTMTSNVNTATMPSRIGNTSQEAIQAMTILRDKATNLMMNSVEKLEEEAIEAMMKPLIPAEDEMLDMNEVLIMALMGYMKETAKDGPSSESIEAVFKMMYPFSDSVMEEAGTEIRGATMSEDSTIIVEFFDTIAEDE
ncbi:hypothetical protein LTR95_006907 [Oleoguttula sp. CCFEE 5521]